MHYIVVFHTLQWEEMTSTKDCLLKRFVWHVLQNECENLTKRNEMVKKLRKRGCDI